MLIGPLPPPDLFRETGNIPALLDGYVEWGTWRCGQPSNDGLITLGAALGLATRSETLAPAAAIMAAFGLGSARR